MAGLHLSGVSALLLAICLAVFWYGSPPQTGLRPAYILRDEGGRLAVYHGGGRRAGKGL